MREFFKVALVAKSGGGKTYSLRNLDPETTGFINMENKPLPFINKFVYYSCPKNYQEAYQKLIEFGQNEKIKCIVLDTFSAYQDDVLIQASRTKKGFDVLLFSTLTEKSVLNNPVNSGELQKWTILIQAYRMTNKVDMKEQRLTSEESTNNLDTSAGQLILPGINNQTFYLEFKEDWFKPNSILFDDIV